MAHGSTKLAWLMSVCLVLTLHGCGSGMLGDDDVTLDNCSVGLEQPYKPAAFPASTSADKVQVFLFRGLVNTYSFGLDQLADKLGSMNLPAHMVDWPTWQYVAQNIVEQYPNWPEGTAIVLVGHSYGGDDAIHSARYLNDANIPVDLVILLDATSPNLVPKNVKHCIHFYIPTLWGSFFPTLFAGNPVLPDFWNDTSRVSNYVFIPEFFGEGVGCANHFSIDVNVLAHNLVIEQVLQCIDPETYPDPMTRYNFPATIWSSASQGSP